MDFFAAAIRIVAMDDGTPAVDVAAADAGTAPRDNAESVAQSNRTPFSSVTSSGRSSFALTPCARAQAVGGAAPHPRIATDCACFAEDVPSPAAEDTPLLSSPSWSAASSTTEHAPIEQVPAIAAAKSEIVCGLCAYAAGATAVDVPADNDSGALLTLEDDVPATLRVSGARLLIRVPWSNVTEVRVSAARRAEPNEATARDDVAQKKDYHTGQAAAARRADLAADEEPQTLEDAMVRARYLADAHALDTVHKPRRQAWPPRYRRAWKDGLAGFWGRMSNRGTRVCGRLARLRRFARRRFREGRHVLTGPLDAHAAGVYVLGEALLRIARRAHVTDGSDGAGSGAEEAVSRSNDSFVTALDSVCVAAAARKKIEDIAYMCLAVDPVLRPCASDVLVQLHAIWEHGRAARV